MKIGIIGAMEEEIRLLKAQIINLQEIVLYNKVFYTGQIAEHDIILVQSGIGKVNATIIATLIVQHFAIDLMINTGTAGALHSGLKVGDIVVADSLVYHDVDVTGFGYKIGQMAGMPEQYYPDIESTRVAKNVCQSLDIQAISGQIVSGDQFVNDKEMTARIKQNFPKAKACEMESTAIAQTADVLGIPFVIIRAISDSADEQATMSFDEFVVLASQASATIVLEMLYQI